MRLRNLGRSGLRVSLVGLGCNNFGGRIDLDASREVVHRALDVGITLFDTADIYGERGGSEEALGAILGDRRKDIVLATKFASPMDDEGVLKGASRRYIMSAVEASLKRLKTDWIDLYQMHVPDPLTPVEETLRALDDLITAGKVRYVGSSNFAGWQIVEAEWTARHLGLERFVSAQDEYSLLVRDVEEEVVPAVEAYGIGFLPFFPLASGLLTGKYKRGEPLPAGTRFANGPNYVARWMNDENFTRVERLGALAEAHGRSMLELAVSWLAAHPFVSSVIAGATKPEQVERNVQAAGWMLTPEELGEIDKISPL
jgi:aryl-alcohol dehydrogenase-like predicted oxidoreductase